MEAEAKVNFDYLWRRALFSLVLIGWGLWSVYDGAVAWPRFNSNHGYERYTELRAQCREDVQQEAGSDLTAYEEREAMHARWTTTYRPRFRRYLQSTDWWKEFKSNIEGEDGNPKEGLEAVEHLEDEYHGKWDLRGQFIMALICLPLGLLSGFFVARNSLSHFSADGEGLHGFDKDPIPYDAIESIDRTRWDNKGIAKLHVRQGERTRKVVLDDWKFRGMAQILETIETHRPDLAPEEKSEQADEETPQQPEGEVREQNTAAGEEKDPEQNENAAG